MSEFEKIEAILEHIGNVQRNCNKLGLIIIKQANGDPKQINFGRMLISHGQIHDNSKLGGIEWLHLFSGDDLLFDVIKHHSETNPHHPEYWGSIHDMPEIYVAEMVCDCTARSQEFGTNIREWFERTATKKYGFSMEDRVGVWIKKYLDILLPKPF